MIKFVINILTRFYKNLTVGQLQDLIGFMAISDILIISLDFKFDLGLFSMIWVILSLPVILISSILTILKD